MKTRKWLRRLIAGTGILAVGLVFLSLIVSLVVRQLAVRRADRDFPAPGRLVEFDGRISHIHCTGTGSPTILLESGLDDQGSWGWADIRDELARVSRVCAYDRAGFLWSEPREEPRDAERISRELHALLAAASEAPPYVMVGHSNAGLMVRVYDAQFPGEVLGFVFIDASHPEQDRRLPTEIQDLIKQRKAEPDHRWLFRLLAPYRMFAPEPSTPRTAYWWRSLPEGVLAEGRAIDAMSEQAGRTGSLGHRPVAVLTAGVPLSIPGVSDEGNAAMRRVWLELHGELAGLSTNSDHRIVEGAGHYIHRDRPAAVVAAIRDVVTAVRGGGSTLAPVSVDGDAPSVWQAVARPIELKGTDGPIYAVAWAPDGRTLASAGYRQVNLWRPGADAPLRTFKAHSDLVFGVAWSPDGASIASVGDDGVARVWSPDTLLQRATFQTGPARAVKWSPDGRRLAIGSGVRMQIWQAASRDLQHTALPRGQISSVSWSPDGRTVAVSSVNGMVTLWSAQSGSLVAKMNAGDQGRNDANGVTWSPGGRILATAHGARGRGEIRFWSPAGRLLQTLASPSGWLRGIGWSPDGLWLAAGGEDGRVRIWNTESGEVAATLATDSQPVWSVAWSPDGGLLAAGNTGSRVAGGTVSVWQASVRVVSAGDASNRARTVEATLLKRGAAAAPAASKAPRVATVFKDDGAYGAVTAVEPPFGNLETSFVQTDLRSLGIAFGDSFNIRCREKGFPLLLGTSVDDVARGEWVAYFSLEGALIVARYFGNAAEESGCKAGDSVFVVRRRQ